MEMEALNAGPGMHPSPAGRRLCSVPNLLARGVARGALLRVWVLLPLMPVLGVVLSRMSGVR